MTFVVCIKQTVTTIQTQVVKNVRFDTYNHILGNIIKLLNVRSYHYIFRTIILTPMLGTRVKEI